MSMSTRGYVGVTSKLRRDSKIEDPWRMIDLHELSSSFKTNNNHIWQPQEDIYRLLLHLLKLTETFSNRNHFLLCIWTKSKCCGRDRIDMQICERVAVTFGRKSRCCSINASAIRCRTKILF